MVYIHQGQPHQWWSQQQLWGQLQFSCFCLILPSPQSAVGSPARAGCELRPRGLNGVSEGWRQSQSLWSHCGLDTQATKVRGALLPGGRRLNASAFGGPESLHRSSPLWVSAVGMWLRSTQSMRALPPFLVIGWDTMNIGFLQQHLITFWDRLLPLSIISSWLSPAHRLLCFTSHIAALSRSVKSCRSSTFRGDICHSSATDRTCTVEGKTWGKNGCRVCVEVWAHFGSGGHVKNSIGE